MAVPRAIGLSISQMTQRGLTGKAIVRVSLELRSRCPRYREGRGGSGDWERRGEQRGRVEDERGEGGGVGGLHGTFAECSVNANFIDQTKFFL